MKIQSVKNLTVAALLIALGILIPMVMPKIVIGPASYTLGSHVPAMIAMFFSPLMVICVALGTAIGFFLTLPPIIGLRALSHLVFVTVGAFYLQKNPQLIQHPLKLQVFNFVLAVIHASFEVVVVFAFAYFGNVANTTFDRHYLIFLFGMIGLGGLIHSMIDFNIAYIVARAIQKQANIPVFTLAMKKTNVH
ncbi:hypothetical protein [uncultured Enterococcus sp.]|uniref:hypothetical protein n=1 Tax=uncultured Enterococcus sp. TaxID=167972 RepID=UPI00261A1FD2|nr:hypothetical protein [uncultured Enterococcus sp.]